MQRRQNPTVGSAHPTPDVTPPADQPRHTYPPSHRIGGVKAFRLVFDEGKQARRGPLVLYYKPNGLGHPRLGLTVPRRVGNATKRVRVKRMLREAYRLGRHEFPPFDLVFVVRPHRPMGLEAYREIVGKLVTKAARSPSDDRSGATA